MFRSMRWKYTAILGFVSCLAYAQQPKALPCAQVDFTLIFDISPSVKGVEKQVGIIAQAITQAYVIDKPTLHMGIVVFDDNGLQLHALSSNQSSIVDKARSLEIDGNGTHIYEGLKSAQNVFADHVQPRRANVKRVALLVSDAQEYYPDPKNPSEEIYDLNPESVKQAQILKDGTYVSGESLPVLLHGLVLQFKETTTSIEEEETGRFIEDFNLGDFIPYEEYRIKRTPLPYRTGGEQWKNTLVEVRRWEVVRTKHVGSVENMEELVSPPEDGGIIQTLNLDDPARSFDHIVESLRRFNLCG